VIAQFDLVVNSRTSTCGIKFKDFQAPVLFSSTFKALNLEEKCKYFQELSRTHEKSDNGHVSVK